MESDLELDDRIGRSETPEQHDVGAARNVSRLIWPTWKSKNLTELGLGTFNAMETRRNKGNKKKLD